MVTRTHEIIKINGENYVAVKLPDDIVPAKYGSMRKRNTLLFKPESQQHLSGTIRFEAWFIEDIRDRIMSRYPNLTEDELMTEYLGYLHHGDGLDDRYHSFESCNLLHSLMTGSSDCYYSEDLTLFGQSVLSIVMEVYGEGIKEYTYDQAADVERLYIHRIKTDDKTYIRINRHGSPIRVSVARHDNRPAFQVAGIDRLGDMFLDISESPEELFKIGAYALPPLLRQSKILREWRIGRELGIVEDFRDLPY